MLRFGGSSAFSVIAGAVATTALVLAYLSIPAFGIIGGVLTPFPALFYSLKNGRGCGLAIVALSCAALFAYSPGSAAVYLVQGAVISLVLAEALRRGVNADRAIPAAAIAAAGVACAAVAMAASAAGTGFHRFIVAGIDSIIGQSIEMYRSTGIKPEDLQPLEEGLRQTGVMLSQMYPSLLLLFVGFIAAINVSLLVKAGKRLPSLGTIGRFSSFRNADALIWLLIAGGFSLLVPNEPLRFVAINVLAVTLTLYFVQGLAIAASFMERKAVARPWRFLLYFLIIFQPYLAVGITVLGLFDLWGDFRRPKNPKNL